MKETLRAVELHNRLQNTLRSSVAHFREGRDRAGLDDLLNSVQDLENVLDVCAGTGAAGDAPDDVFSVCRDLLACMENQDVTGMTDLLEFEICPLAETWAERCGDVCE